MLVITSSTFLMLTCAHSTMDFAQYFLIIMCFELSEMHSVSDTITDVPFYFRQLSEYPSKLVTIEYTINFTIVEPTIQMDFYTTKDHINLKRNCSALHYGQLLNDKLHIILHKDSSRRNNCKINQNRMFCNGIKKIQDYIPRNYYVSFGFPHN